MLRRFFGRLFQLLGLVGLPGDVRILWNILIPAAPTALTGLWAYTQQASVPVLVLLVLASYVVLLLASVPVTMAITRLRNGERGQLHSGQAGSPGAASRIPSVHTGSIGNIGHVENLHIMAGPRHDEPQEEHDPDPDDELDYETRSHFDDEGIYLPLFTFDDIYVRNKTFTNCRIYGPALIVPSTYHDTFAKNCTFNTEGPENFLWVATEDASGYLGLIALEGCIFEDCDFYRIGLVVKEADYQTWVEGLRERWALQEGSGEPQEIEAPDEEPTNQ